MLPPECGFYLGWQFVEVGCDADLTAPPARNTPTRCRLSQRHQTRDWTTCPGDNDLLASRGAIQQLRQVGLGLIDVDAHAHAIQVTISGLV